MTATAVTRLAVARNGATMPAISKISSVRGKMASAFEWIDWDERASMSRQRRPRRAHSCARNSPTGPAPTINTSVSIAALRILHPPRLSASLGSRSIATGSHLCCLHCAARVPQRSYLYSVLLCLNEPLSRGLSLTLRYKLPLPIREKQCTAASDHPAATLCPAGFHVERSTLPRPPLS